MCCIDLQAMMALSRKYVTIISILPCSILLVFNYVVCAVSLSDAKDKMDSPHALYTYNIFVTNHP